MALTPTTTSPVQIHRRYQYSLSHLLALMAGVAVLAGAWRMLGAWSLLAPLMAAVAIVPAIWHPRWFYCWLLPTLWTAIAWMNFYHPGDEYGGFVVGSLAGVWIFALVKMNGSPHDMLPPLLMAGCATMALVGLALDALRVRWHVWIVLTLGAAMLLFASAFGSYPSVERALSKNGSIAAYVLPSINLGTYFATIVCIMVAGSYRLGRFVKRRKTTSPASTVALRESAI